MPKINFKNIDEYNDFFKNNKDFDAVVFERLQTLRKLVHKAQNKNIVEKISYQIPTFLYTDIGSEVLCHYAAFKKHISFVYPFSKDFLSHFKEELKNYKISKAAIQIPNKESFPTKLLEKMIIFRLQEVKIDQKRPKDVLHKPSKEIQKVLTKDKKLFELWQKLTPLSQNEWICWTTSPKKEETRKEHLERMQKDIMGGKKRPCCWPGCPHRKSLKNK